MKKFLSLILLIATTALAGSPMIFKGTVAKNLASGGIEISNSSNKQILDITTDPRLGAGVAAEVGTIALGYASFFIKTGTADTDWSTTLSGAPSSTDTALAKWSGIDGDVLADTGVLLDASNNMSGLGTVSSGTQTVGASQQHATGFSTTTGTKMTLTSGESDGVGAIGTVITSSGLLLDGTAKLLSVQNGGFEKFYVDLNGGAYFNGSVTVGGTTTPLGVVNITDSLTAKKEILLEDPGVGTNYWKIKSPTLGSNLTMTMPSAIGTSGQCFKTDGVDTMSWGDCLAASTVAASLGYTPENVANKSTVMTTLNDTYYPTNQAVHDFVVSSLSGLTSYFFYNTASDIGGGYLQMKTPGSTAALQTISTLNTTDATLLATFATQSGVPGVTFLPSGVLRLHIHAARTSGTRPVQLYAEIYKRVLAGTETLLATTGYTEAIATTNGQVETDATLSEAVVLLSTDRLVTKIYTHFTTGTGTPDVALYIEDDTSSRLELPAAVADTSMGASTLKGNSTTATATAQNLTTLQVVEMLNVASTTNKGVVPILPNDASLFYNGVGGFTAPTGGSSTLATNKIFIGDASNVPVAKTVVGDASLNSAGVLSLNANVVGNSAIATMAASTIKGNSTTGTAQPTDLTTLQVVEMLDVYGTNNKGVVPKTNGVGATYFLNATNNWAVPAGGGAGITDRTPHTISASTMTFALTDAISSSGSTYTLVVSDNSSQSTIMTIPPNSSVAFPTGTQIDIMRIGSSTATVAPGSGVTLGSVNGTSTVSQYGMAHLVKLATDTWYLAGNTSGYPTATCSGCTVTYSGDYVTYDFTSSGTWTPTIPTGSVNTTVQVSVIGGGGSGGANDSGGGGGAGGYRYYDAYGITNQSYAVTVGAGGSITNATTYVLATDSSFGSLTGTAGGRGGYGAADPTTGGSGAGGGANFGNTDPGAASSPVTNPVQGYSGGTSYSNGVDDMRGGGGGGACGAGATATGATVGGNGGIACMDPILGIYLGGGGGGGHYTSSGSPTSGGSGVGGNGGNATTAATAPTANTGSGGGGIGNTAGGSGSNGAAGRVAIKMKYR